MKDARRLTHCRLCRAELPEPFLDLGETALANELVDSPDVEQDTFPLQLVQCGQCEHVQLSIAVDPKRLFPPTYPYQSGTSPVFRRHLKELARTVTSMFPRGGRLLDIGSNDGSFLDCVDELDSCINTFGVDPTAPAGDTQAFFSHELAKRKYDARSFEIITALNVFAHVDDLHDFTAGVAELLADDGVFIFEVGYLPDVVEKGLLGCVYHEHVSYHHLTPLIHFFGQHGLVIVDAHRVDSQGGSVRVFVKTEAGAVQAGRSQRYLDLWMGERGLDVSKLEQAAVEINQRAMATADRLEGKRVCGYGAPAKLTTLLALCSERTWPDCIFDDNPLKVGKYTPGTHIPIVSSSELMQRNPDALVLFSANFVDEIKSRFPDWRGEWIVP